MKNDRVNLRDNSRRVLTYFGSLCLGLAVFAGTATLGAKEDSSSLASAGISSTGSLSTDSASRDSSSTTADGDTATTTDDSQGRQRKAFTSKPPQDQGDSDPLAAGRGDPNSVMHVGRVIGNIPVVSKSGQPAVSRAAGELLLGDPCSCDQDCAAVGDACNLVQCIVRSICSIGDNVPCTSNADCEAAGAGSCTPDPFDCDLGDPPNCSFVQRCDTVQLVGWPCDEDGLFCTQDQCVDDGFDTGHSICEQELDSAGGSPLSPCAKQCVGGPSNDRRCTQASDCSQGSCQITAGGLCDEDTDACYVGPSVELAIGRCCNDDVCTETTETDCTNGGGAWYRYRNPEDQEGENCVCPKYGSGVSPSGDDLGTIGLVRPSGLICHAASVQTNVMVYCEDLDGDEDAINFCQKRCVGGDNERQPCQVDNPDCGQFGACSVTGQFCLVSNEGSDCGICTNIGGECVADGDCAGEETCDLDTGQTCDATNVGTCQEDRCISNDIEGGCEDGFLNIGDDYSIENGSFLRLSQFRFRGGVSNLAEDFVIEFWDSSGTRLVDAFGVFNLPRTGTFDWAIQVDCFPNCDVGQLEVAEQNPIIIPPTGYVVMRSPRTVGTINGAATFWSQTDNPADVGFNDNTKAWVDGDPNGILGTNVFIFELVGTKVADPIGACCDDADTCEDTLRWECGLCTDTETPVLCASTLHDCPRGGEAGSFCQFNRWFGPISHDDFLGAGLDLTTCSGKDGLFPCNSGACCDGVTCTVTKEQDCLDLGFDYRGPATDCTPNCCPVITVTGSDCACATSLCVEEDGTSTITLCEDAGDCEEGQTCVLMCEPVGVTQHRHPYECMDDIGSPLEPAQSCDPANGNADCPPIECTVAGDCPLGMDCVLDVCEDTTNMTCEQSFTTPFAIVRNDTIAPLATLFISEDGDGCSLNSNQDRVGWFELVNLVDPTPGDGSDDCFILTVGLCCTDPILTPVWPFLSQFLNCPCAVGSDVFGIAPDFDISGDQLDGFGANSKASLPGRCEDGNYSATFTVPPGEYAYQVNADTFCVGSITPCLNNDDCPGTSCVVPNAEYSVVFTVESCQIAACCVDETCVLTNELDCTNLDGNFLGGGDQPVVTCQIGACDFGSCCLEGQCLDGDDFDTKGECEDGEGGEYFGGVTCESEPCPACPYNSLTNCQQLQTIFGSPELPWIDRNPENAGGGDFGRVFADDIQFGGSVVDEICWNTWMLGTGARCTQSVDTTWEIRVYDTDPSCPGIPDTELGLSTITVRNKIEGTGQSDFTWHYSGSLDAPITLTGNPGVPGDTYWFEISCFGEDPCGCRAAWSRDQGNDHGVWVDIEFPTSIRQWQTDQSFPMDQGFCENSGVGSPDTVLGACCRCGNTCLENLSALDCRTAGGGRWVPCTDCAGAECPDTPLNDDCASAIVVSNVPVSIDGSAFIEIEGENVCSTDDGPLLDATPDGQCAGVFNQMHADVWYAYTATSCGDLTVESCGGQSTNDQIISVYGGSVADCPVTVSDELTCGDDTCGPVAGPSTVTLRVNEGDEILVRIGGWNNEVPGGFDGNPRGSWTAKWSLTDSCAAVDALLQAPAPHQHPKNRYISVDTRGIEGDNPPNLHISVSVDSTVVNGLNFDDGQRAPIVWWANDPDEDCISYVTTAKPAEEPNWSGCATAHLTGCPLVPTTTYSIVAESDGNPSAPVLLSTQAKPGIKWHSDCVGAFSGTEWSGPNGQTNIDDAVAAIKTFQNPSFLPGCATPPCNATHKSVTDVAPNLTPGSPNNKIVNIEDVLIIILGFGGQEYPGTDLTQCE